MTRPYPMLLVVHTSDITPIQALFDREDTWVVRVGQNVRGSRIRGALVSAPPPGSSLGDWAKWREWLFHDVKPALMPGAKLHYADAAARGYLDMAVL